MTMLAVLSLVARPAASAFGKEATLGCPSRHCRRFKATRAQTPYTLNDAICPPTDDEQLFGVVAKHIGTLDLYLTHKPIALHTQQAFQQVIDVLLDMGKNSIILDSGCGTARSTLLLGKRHPDHVVIGVDRSLARLNRNAAYRRRKHNHEAEPPFVQRATNNVLLVRAELSDFWRLLAFQQLQQPSKFTVTNHYLLYPNPYPKRSRLQSRWYAHPSFPLLLQLGGHIHVRSNWEGYLVEFAKSIVYADKCCRDMKKYTNYAARYVEAARIGPVARTSTTEAWTNFEQKYQDCGEPTFQLDLYDATDETTG